MIKIKIYEIVVLYFENIQIWIKSFKFEFSFILQRSNCSKRMNIEKNVWTSEEEVR